MSHWADYCRNHGNRSIMSESATAYIRSETDNCAHHGHSSPECLRVLMTVAEASGSLYRSVCPETSVLARFIPLVSFFDGLSAIAVHRASESSLCRRDFSVPSTKRLNTEFIGDDYIHRKAINIYMRPDSVMHPTYAVWLEASPPSQAPISTFWDPFSRSYRRRDWAKSESSKRLPID